jgi:hypothetical protein
MKRSLPLVSAVVCSAAAAIPLFVSAPAYAATACADLAKLSLPDTKITLGATLAAPRAAAAAYWRCACHGRAGDQAEVWLPEGSAERPG